MARPAAGSQMRGESWARGNRSSWRWLLFLGLCTILVGLKNRQNLQYLVALDAYQYEQRQLDYQHEEAYHGAHHLLLRGLRSGPDAPGFTVDELREELLGDAPLELVENNDPLNPLKADWIDTSSGSHWTFFFDQSRHLVGVNGHYAAVPSPQPPPVPRSTFEDAGEQSRRLLATTGKVVWLALLVCWPLARSRRREVAHLLLGLAISVTLADAVKPNFTLMHVFSNDAVWFGAVMTIVSLAALVAVSPDLRAFVSTHVLPRRFGIAWLLGATALLAVLVALGWYGWVIGSVLIVGAIAYAAMAHLFRPARP